MNLFKKQKNTTNDISHVLINKKKRKFPEPIIAIRQIEEKDVDEVRQLLHDHFNSLTLPAVVYWSIQHIYDLLVIIAINYIFFLDIRKIFYFLVIFVIYLYIRAKLEFLRHIRKDCPDLDNLYQSYVKVEGCNFWVAEVFDSNSDSVSRTTCSDIYEREKVICDQDKEEPLKVFNNDTGNGSVNDVNSTDEEVLKNGKKNKKNIENEMETVERFIDDEMDEHNKDKEYDNEELKFHDEGKFGEKNDYNVQSKIKEEKEKKKKDEKLVDTFETEKLNGNNENTEDTLNKKKNEEKKENETKTCYKTVNIDLCENNMDAAKNKSANDIIEEMKNNKNIDGNFYTSLYYEKDKKCEESKQRTTKETYCGFTGDKEGDLKMQNINETTDGNTNSLNSNNNDNCCSSSSNKNNGDGINDVKDKNNDTDNNNNSNSSIIDSNKNNNINNDTNNNSTNNSTNTTTIITANNNNNNNNDIVSSINNNNNSNNTAFAKIKEDEDCNVKYMSRKIVGCVGIVPYKGDNSIAQLVRMVVKKDNRRMRIGSRLLTQLENFAYEQNYKELKVFTNNLNTDSLYFVKQHGFSLSQIVRRGLMRGDLLIWSKILNKDEFYKFNSSDIQSYTTNILD